MGDQMLGVSGVVQANPKITRTKPTKHNMVLSEYIYREKAETARS